MYAILHVVLVAFAHSEENGKDNIFFFSNLIYLYM